MKHLNCILKGHQLSISKDVTYHVKEYRCQHCNAKFTTSTSGTVTPLTSERKEINSILERIHKKRTLRKLKQQEASLNY